MRKVRAKVIRKLSRELYSANIIPNADAKHIYTRLKDMWKHDRELYLKHFRSK